MSSNKPIGPGPGAYNLPSTFGDNICYNRMQRSPQFSFGKQARSCNNPLKVEGPGPASYHLGNVTRYGTIASESYSVYNRR
ncbi:outer dense fiber protein 3-B [Drosophila eugracilis]|uniref:outer dense fiber protein 3-B n=1 Tax=Drosophila eugracilis TaxID=29029 RepID=UPI0007E70A5D|nr:outer dense fiber protein 3-B [Drosophila eugracilis]